MQCLSPAQGDQTIFCTRSRGGVENEHQLRIGTGKRAYLVDRRPFKREKAVAQAQRTRVGCVTDIRVRLKPESFRFRLELFFYRDDPGRFLRAPLQELVKTEMNDIVTVSPAAKSRGVQDKPFPLFWRPEPDHTQFVNDFAAHNGVHRTAESIYTSSGVGSLYEGFIVFLTPGFLSTTLFVRPPIMNIRDKKIAAILSKTTGFNRSELRRTDADGRTPLMLATIQGNADIVRAMVEAGAEVEATDYNGDTALAHANRTGNGEVGRLLVERGADPEHKNFAGKAAGVPAISTAPTEASGSAQGGAAPASEGDEAAQESSRESILDLRKTVLAEASAQMRPTIAQPTQDLIDAIEDEEYNWSAIQLASIDLPRIVYHLLERDSGVRVNLYDDALTTWMHVLTAIAEIDRRWMRALLSMVNPNVYHSTMFGEDWEPRVLWNGKVLVRNGHRVLGIQYSETVFFDEDTRETILQEIGQLGASGTIISEHDGVVEYMSDARNLNLNGNNIVFITETDALESNAVLTEELLSDTAGHSRYGIVALRVFRGGMHLYETFRADDELDFVVDSGILAPVRQLDGDEVRIHEFAAYPLPDTYSPDVGELNSDFRDVTTWRREREKSEKILHEAIRTEFVESRIEGADDDLPDYSRMEALGVLDEVSERLCDSMGSAIETALVWAPEIFADAPEKIRGFNGSYPASSVSADVADSIVIVFSVPEKDDDADTDLTAIADTSKIEGIFQDVSLKTDVIFEIAIPISTDSWEPWVPIDTANVVRLKEKVNEIATAEDCSIAEVIGGRFLRCRFALRNLEPTELGEFGKTFGGALSDLVESEALVVGESFTLLVPSMGILQSFDGDDIDSGNLM